MPLWWWLQELLDGRWNDCVPDQEHSLGDTLPRNSVQRGLFVYTAVTQDTAAGRTIPLVEGGAARTVVAHCNGVVRAVTTPRSAPPTGRIPSSASAPTDILWPVSGTPTVCPDRSGGSPTHAADERARRP
jgi:hypothetical protein